MVYKMKMDTYNSLEMFMTPKEVKFALGQIECTITHKIVSKYIKGLEQMLAESATTINQHEELLDIKDEEIKSLRKDVESLEYFR